MEEKLRSGKPDYVLDLTGESCPEPQIEIVKKLNLMKVGEVLEVVSDEEPIDVTIPMICKTHGYPCLTLKEGSLYKTRILKNK
ncbi:MAG: sulfurtransferase TusA family protein [Metallosphaera sp.]|uniref:SirA family protein n=1 Tax=Metallosphaera cuprina (strain Ar-4) TaxID=1006006 RepID=F4G3F8_METCR|nr:sulfurtransferase TusA family protein [Metallosphaera cuprina]AEB95328.1 SirA family protein [Metallosphaera cuprina Ar-4]